MRCPCGAETPRGKWCERCGNDKERQNFYTGMAVARLRALRFIHQHCEMPGYDRAVFFGNIKIEKLVNGGYNVTYETDLYDVSQSAGHAAHQ